MARTVRVARALATAAVAAAAAAAGVAGCGGAAGGGSGDPGGAGRPLDVQVWADAEERPLYEQLAAEYGRRTGERVRIVTVPDRKAHLQRLATAFAARRPPAIFVLNHRYVGGFMRPGAIAPVGPRLGRDRERYLDVALDAFTLDGELQCLPQNASSLVAYVNLDRFRDAGIAPPGGGWTFDEFEQAAQRLQARAGPDAHAVGIEPSVIRFAPFVWSAGGEVVDDTAAPRRFTLDEGTADLGLFRVMGLRALGLTPTRAEAEGQPLDERFLAGRLGVFFGSRREVPAFRRIEGFDWDVVPLPSLGRPANVLHSDGFCLAQGPDTERAWRFTRFALGPEGARVLAEGGRTVPSLRSVLESPAFLDPARKPRSSRVFVDGLRGMRRLPSTRGYVPAQDAADLALERAFYGELTLEEAFDRIERETGGRLGETG